MVCSIRGKLVGLLMGSLLFTVISVSGIAAYYNYSGGIHTINSMLSVTSNAAAARIRAEFASPMTIVTELAGRPEFQQDTPSLEGLATLLAEVKKRNSSSADILSVSYADKNGNNLEGRNIADNPLFAKVQQSLKPDISDVMSVNGIPVFGFSAPIIKDGHFKGLVYITVPINYLQSIINSLSFNRIGYAYIINRDGTTLAHNASKIRSQAVNATHLSKTDSRYAASAAIQQRMMSGETGTALYQNPEGKMMFAAFTPILDTEGWSIAVVSPKSVLTEPIWDGIWWTTLFVIALLLLMGIIVLSMSRRIALPITFCANRLHSLSRGDLSSPIPTGNPNDETGQLASSTKDLTNTLHAIIEDMNRVLGELSNGNLDVRAKDEHYKGDFRPMLESLRSIARALNEMFVQFHASLAQVASGSEQVAMGAQTLSESATQQASAVEDVSSTLGNLSEKIKKNTKQAEDSSVLLIDFMTKLQNSHRDLETMITTMGTMAATSESIRTVVKTIEDIAFKTDILAVNASIEAARISSESKGFGVVADEVRKLASKTADAATSTNRLVENTLEAIASSKLAAETATRNLEGIIGNSNDIAENSRQMVNFSREQNTSVSEVTYAIEQIAALAQSNSATAEESAAASEELSSQAILMRDLLSRFQLRKD